MRDDSNSFRRLGRIPVAAVLAVAVILAGLAAATAGGSDAIVIGRTASTPKPACPTPDVRNPPPRSTCQVMGRVTGFQLSADGRKHPFRIRRPGRIVAWSIDLSRPSREERAFFAEQLSKSGPPKARLSVLKHLGKRSYRLVRASPPVELAPFYGRKPIFTLADPIRVRPGMIVALTTPTWAPNLGVARARRSDRWRASRERGQCGDEPRHTPKQNETDLLKRSRPQLKVGGKRNYACSYSGARLLYWAYLAPRPGGSAPSGS